MQILTKLLGQDLGSHTNEVEEKMRIVSELMSAFNSQMDNYQLAVATCVGLNVKANGTTQRIRGAGK